VRLFLSIKGLFAEYVEKMKENIRGRMRRRKMIRITASADRQAYGHVTFVSENTITLTFR
jgi:hypothetical protein